ncbi:alpha/beta fold hydrolase [Pyruvatibacter sp.]|uniref:alpha/beta fold hydrolase n=1 Tax=Pyruvatibacter sp. TaxID=1981328 RepID=UPI003266D8E0
MSTPDSAPVDAEAVSAAIDAIYVFASEPDNWEEFAEFLADIALVSDTAQHHSFLSTLKDHASRAQDLAARLYPDAALQNPLSEMALVGFAANGEVVAFNEAARAVLAIYCHGEVAVNTPLAFSAEGGDADNAKRLTTALKASMTRVSQGPEPIRLCDTEGRERMVGYVARHDAVPDTIRSQLVTANSRPDMVLVMPTGRVEPQAAERYQELLGLTGAESRLALKLRDGLTMKDAAAALGISINTARNQLHSIFDRLGVNRQGDLVRHLTEMMALAGVLGADVEMSVPVNSGQPKPAMIQLSNGRCVAYREFGAPGGVPLMLMPSSLRSSLGWPPESQAARDLGIRLIVPERPGLGLSDPDPDMTPASVAADMEEVADALGLDRFILSARSSGSPFGLAIAARMGRRVSRVVLASPRLGVPAARGNRPGMLDYFFSGVRRHPWLLKSAVAILRTKVSEKLLTSLVFHFFERSPVDVAQLKSNEALLQNSIDAVHEALLHTDQGLFRESELFVAGMDLDLAGLTAPVDVWHGTRDQIITADEARAALTQLGIVPASFQPVEDEGHLFVTNHHRVIMEAAVRSWETDTAKQA